MTFFKKSILIKIIACIVAAVFISSDVVYSMSLRVPISAIELKRIKDAERIAYSNGRAFHEDLNSLPLDKRIGELLRRHNQRPDNIKTMIGISEAYLGSGNLEEAEKWAHKAIKTIDNIEKTGKFSFDNVGEHRVRIYGIFFSVYFSKGMLKEALEAADKRIKIASKDELLVGYHQKFTALIILGKPEEALKISEECIRIAPSGDSAGYDLKSKALFALGVKMFILEGEKAVREFAQKQLEELYPQERYYLSLIHWLERMAGNDFKGILRGVPEFSWRAEQHIIKRHMADNPERYTHRDFSRKTTFPKELSKESVVKLLKDALRESSDSLYALRDVPKGADLSWWPEDDKIVYFPKDGRSPEYRLVFIVNEKNEIETAYPSMGGISSFKNESIIPMAVPIYNRNSRRPINIYAGDSQEGLFLALQNNAFEKLTFIQREKLILLAAIYGEPCGEDNDFTYYRYPIDRNFSKWKKISKSEIFVKVDKKSFKLIKILGTMPKDGLYVIEKTVNRSSVNESL